MADDDNADAQNQCVLCGGKETLMMFQPSGFYYNNSEPRTQKPNTQSPKPKIGPGASFWPLRCVEAPIGKGALHDL